MARDAWRVALRLSARPDRRRRSSIATFPDPSATVPNRDAADKACREEGITDPQLLHDCIIDFGVTNGFLFANQYAHQQKVLEARAPLAPMNAATSAAPKEKVIVMAGAITDKTQPTQFTFEAEANDVIYMHQTGLRRSLRDVDDLLHALRSGRQADRRLPSGLRHGPVLCCRSPAPTRSKATWRRIRSASTACRSGSCGTIASRPSSTATSSRATSIRRAAHDLYTFTAKAGDLVQMSGQGLRALRHVHVDHR